MDETTLLLLIGVKEIHEEGCLERPADEETRSAHFRRYANENTYGQRELSLIPSRACTMASSLVIARTAPFDAVSEYDRI